MIGSTNLSGGGGVGSDELTATAANVLEETTYVGADTDDELAEGTMQHLTNRATITHTAENATKVIEGDAAFTSINSDGTARAEIRYNGTEGFITPNTLFAVDQGTMASAGGLTAEKLLEGQSAFGIAGAATSDATAAANQISSGKIAYVKGSKITGTLAERGQSQYGNFGQGNGYVAINALPEGIYRSNGAAWAPEARIATSTLASGIGLNASVIKKGVSILGITGTCEGYFENPLYVYNYGTWKYVSSGGMSTTSITGKETMVEMYMYTNSSNIQFYGVDHSKGNYIASGCARTNSPMNLSGYSMLNVRFNVTSSKSSSIGYCQIGVSTNSSDSMGYTATASSSSLGEVVVSSNITSLSGWYYIYVNTEINSAGTGNFYIYQIYLT